MRNGYSILFNVQALFITSSPIQRDPLHSIIFFVVLLLNYSKLTNSALRLFFSCSRKKCYVVHAALFWSPVAPHLSTTNNNKKQRRVKWKVKKRNPSKSINYDSRQCTAWSFFLFSFLPKRWPRADENEEHPTKSSKRNAWSVGLVHGKSSTDHSRLPPFFVLPFVNRSIK